MPHHTRKIAGSVIAFVVCFMGLFSNRVSAAPVRAPIPFTVGPGAVGSIGGRMGSIVSIPAGASLMPSPRGILLPVGTVVNVNGQRETLTQATPFVLTTGGIRPPTLPNTGSIADMVIIVPALLGLVLLVAGRTIYRSKWSIHS